MMTGIDFALVTFVCTFAAALVGMFVRNALPPAHVSKESQDIIRLGMSLVATMTALLLGLVTAAANEPGFFGNYLGTQELPGAATRDSRLLA